MHMEYQLEIVCLLWAILSSFLLLASIESFLLGKHAKF